MQDVKWDKIEIRAEEKNTKTFTKNVTLMVEAVRCVNVKGLAKEIADQNNHVSL